MVRFTSSTDVNFQRVSSVIRNWVEAAHPALSAPPQDEKAQDKEQGSPFPEESYVCYLQTLDFSDTRSRRYNVEPAFADTYGWLFADNPGFRAWLEANDPIPIFWISGKPGSGKSTLMKYALEHQITRKCLEENYRDSAILTSFFFHDRGTAMQKSIQGFLCEIMRSILKFRKDAFLLVKKALDVPFLGRDFDFPNLESIDVDKLVLGLRSILSGLKSSLNCCLFVDGLDEHDGNHRELVRVLGELALQPSAPRVTFRLCLAGRPENIFVDAFRHFPGFAIHEYTRNDIRRYANERIQKECFSDLKDNPTSVKSILDLIEKKANGVFMWVRLVVNEVVEGIDDGDTLDEIELLLSEIPTELSELYVRAVRRVPRRSALAIRRHREEASILFHIVASAPYFLPPVLLLNAVRFHCCSRRLDGVVEALSNAQIQPRLNSRSSGLLECVRPHPDTKAFHSAVQFIHQTVKDFFLTGEGFEAIAVERRGSESDGLVLMLEYLLHLFKSDDQGSSKTVGSFPQATPEEDATKPSQDSQCLRGSPRMETQRILEKYMVALDKAGKPAALWIGLQSSPENVFHSGMEPGASVQKACSTLRGLSSRQQRVFEWLLTYAAIGCHYSLAHLIRHHGIALSNKYAFFLFYLASQKGKHKVLQVLRRAGIGSDELRISFKKALEKIEHAHPPMRATSGPTNSPGVDELVHANLDVVRDGNEGSARDLMRWTLERLDSRNYPR